MASRNALGMRKGEAGSFGLCLFKQVSVVSPKQSQIVCSAPLHEAQITSVINHARKIGIFIVDTDLHSVTAIKDFAVKIRFQPKIPFISKNIAFTSDNLSGFSRGPWC